MEDKVTEDKRISDRNNVHRDGEHMVITVNLDNAYDIIIQKGILDKCGEELNLNRRVLIVTDEGVPAQYAETVKKQCKEGIIGVIGQGETHKSLESFAKLQQIMLDNNFTRKDCVVAVGGGVVGDLAGFVASAYMRGVDFYNIPTTVLSQVDSSVGGKTAINFGGVKNIVGAFYQPKKVLIDPQVLNTLSPRMISNGIAEAIKMSATFDKKVFEEMESKDEINDFTPIIAEAIKTKAMVVEQDEKENGLRKVLNFGHTIGHGIEIASDGALYHGESVALGMLCMCDDSVKDRLAGILKKLNMPVTCSIDKNTAVNAILHDKKATGNSKISSVYVSELGTFEFRDMSIEELADRLDTVLE